MMICSLLVNVENSGQGGQIGPNFIKPTVVVMFTFDGRTPHLVYYYLVTPLPRTAGLQK